MIRWFQNNNLVMVLAAIAAGCANQSNQAVQASQNEAPSDRQEIIQACSDLVLDYALYRDQHDTQKLVELFTADAQMTVLGQTLKGRAAIRQRTLAAAKGPKTRHMMSTIRITPRGNDRASGISYVAVYAATGAEGQIQSVAGPAIIGNYVDEFERTSEGWRIASRRLDVAFRSNAEP